LKYTEIKRNIINTIKDIPKEIFKTIFKVIIEIKYLFKSHQVFKIIYKLI